MSVHYAPLTSVSTVEPDRGTITRVHNHARRCESCRAILDLAHDLHQSPRYIPNISNRNGSLLLYFRLINLVDDRYNNDFHGPAQMYPEYVEAFRIINS